MAKRGVKIWTVRVALTLVALLVLGMVGVWLFLRGGLAQLDGRRPAAGLSAEVTIVRDAQGIPTISGNHREDVAYATGFVHGQERFFQMDLLRRVGSGELAELFGARAIPVDKSHRLHRFRARADAALAKMTPAERRFLERYTAGVNDGLGALASRPFEYALVGAAPRPWAPADSLLVVWAMYFDLQGMLEPRELARGWIRDNTSAAQLAFLLPEATAWDAPIDADSIAAPAVPLPERAPAWWGKPPGGKPARIAAVDFVDSVGSNNWALAGSRSKHGAAIVADDMHLGIQLPNTWYRLALRFPSADGTMRRVSGVSLPGAPPLVVVGSNGKVAWGFTNSYGDYLDLVEVGTDAARPGEVQTPSGWEKPERHVETILVKGAPAEQFEVRSTTYGPLREAGGKNYAIHWIAHADQAINLNPMKFESADTLDAALSAAATVGIPAQNFVAGDDQGNIGWTIVGAMAGRAEPGIASTFPMAAGDAAAGWQTALAPSDYPVLRNPAGGQLSTANSRQLNGAGAQVIGDGGFDIGARNRQVRDQLSALGTGADVAGVYGIAMDDRAIFMTPWRERALKVLDAAALEGKPQRAEFQRLLKQSWSGRASVDSVGYRLARHFMWSLHEVLYGGANAQMASLDEKATAGSASSRWPAVVARLLDEQPAGWLPSSYRSWKDVQLAAIDAVIEDLTEDGKQLSAATWGERNTATIVHPIGNAVPFLKRWLSAPADMLPGDANMPRVAGAKFGQSQRMTVSPGREEEGVFNMPGGQSGHPLSPFFLSGHQDWVAGKATPFLPGAAKHTLVLAP
ncbi:penicillin acylase family protein [Massilia soli]|uniref:Penicillin acylase family protein n=1 Tax=Massilia soli TaxID=2792854 RepID=A0ABS7SLR0_9BURK|nr:penicillin acylase family protein [Massilia soli]MBZ2206982.1 penicillin acylase family protein [Massilia soli]